jgi:hypothetical protein
VRARARLTAKNQKRIEPLMKAFRDAGDEKTFSDAADNLSVCKQCPR